MTQLPNNSEAPGIEEGPDGRWSVAVNELANQFEAAVVARGYVSSEMAFPPWLNGAPRVIQFYARLPDGRARTMHVTRDLFRHVLNRNCPPDPVRAEIEMNVPYCHFERIVARKFFREVVEPDFPSLKPELMSELSPGVQVVVDETLGRNEWFFRQGDGKKPEGGG